MGEHSFSPSASKSELVMPLAADEVVTMDCGWLTLGG